MIVILSNRDRKFLGWARQFVAHDPTNRGLVVIDNIAARAQSEARRNIARYYEPAIQLAGTGGTLIISVGHGAGGPEECNSVGCLIPSDTTIGMIDLLPDGALHIQREHVVYSRDQRTSDQRIVTRVDEIGSRQCHAYSRHYSLSDPRRPPPPELAGDVAACSGASYSRQRLEIREAYDRIGEILRRYRVSNVVFLTCRIGNSEDFLNRVAADWQVSITAYRRRVAANSDQQRQFRVYLHPDAEGQGTNTERARHELPVTDRFNTESVARH
jgi:hypothetical protein